MGPIDVYTLLGLLRDAPRLQAKRLGLLRVARPKAFPVSRAWACQVTGCNPDTLRQWIRRGHVTTYADEQVNLIDVLIRVSDTPGAGRMTSM